MRKVITSVLLLALVIIGLIWFSSGRKSEKSSSENKSSVTGVKLETPIPETKNMKIQSVFPEGGEIPSKYTCSAENINPPLQISGVPGESKSLVLLVNDPDAPAGTWTHWILFNIKPDTTEIRENSVPEGSVQGKTSFGKNKYGGPCPPSGTHRYFFKLYALDKTLDLPENATAGVVENAIKDNILSQTQLMGTYRKK